MTSLHADIVQTASGFKLDPLCMFVCFSGSVQSPVVIPEHFPLQISVHIPDEYLGQISPSLEYSNPQALQQLGHHLSHDVNLQHTLNPVSFLLWAVFIITHTFFPHPQIFNPSDSFSWHILAHQIQLHLIQETWEEHAAECFIVHEFFWMAFVTAFPSFPYGDWPNWDTRISMEGDFISYWISDISTHDHVTQEPLRTLQVFIWEELKGLTAHVCPAPNCCFCHAL
ncbi:hypothetical protein PAXRUDRAFT_161182 [Paxillus rubicundulus Ve08.2h10]|uniref:Uncharacterized protein n=1 Tax=Paxillus rubicundulus Ve08.2h10 TaxID=930991 RepID=A0A0D0C9E6_9AGAM|nr:hypothetical protein PAXRUDRAFT_161182 [Paxillus rubicundulus Ve08.2h10]